MSHYKHALLTAAIIVSFALACFAKPQKMSGKIVAYDPMLHSSKSASSMENQEVVVLDTSNPKMKDRYIKVKVSSFGTTQIEPQYFDGTLPLEVSVFRDHSCDESAPRFVTEMSLEKIAGTYLLTDAFKTQPPAKIKSMECYVAIEKKKK